LTDCVVTEEKGKKYTLNVISRTNRFKEMMIRHDNKEYIEKFYSDFIYLLDKMIHPERYAKVEQSTNHEKDKSTKSQILEDKEKSAISVSDEKSNYTIPLEEEIILKRNSSIVQEVEKRVSNLLIEEPVIKNEINDKQVITEIVENKENEIHKRNINTFVNKSYKIVKYTNNSTIEYSGECKNIQSMIDISKIK
jgi:hypothetical protein